ncbi:unnamed protein product [Cylicocyclus nassatus]|uniref:Uncharacterized protein n=1 Tax=Cylicocyclus nassatus TaxID=53992 RepID=A0AA36H504_CYLNA|nr:unnamed protein product [Cylicocyclus nassatus]
MALKERAESGSHVLEAVRDKMENQEKKRYPEDIRVDDSIYTPKYSLIKLYGPDKHLVLYTQDRAYSRLVVNGKIFSSGIYQERHKRSRQDLLYFEDDDGASGFGSVVIFLHNAHNNEIRVVLKEYRTQDCFSNLEDLIVDSSNQTSQRVRDLLSAIRRNNRYFREIRGYDRKIRCASQIKGTCLLIKYENRAFVLRN